MQGGNAYVRMGKDSGLPRIEPLNQIRNHTMNAKTLEAVTKHGEQLLAIFPNATERDPVALCKKLRRIENSAHRFAEDFCNGLIQPCEDSDIDAGVDRILARVEKVLKQSESGAPVFVNLDPRGYALKICDDWMRANHGRPEVARLHQDLGGYGIVAPDLTAR